MITTSRGNQITSSFSYTSLLSSIWAAVEIVRPPVNNVKKKTHFDLKDERTILVKILIHHKIKMKWNIQIKKIITHLYVTDQWSVTMLVFRGIDAIVELPDTGSNPGWGYLTSLPINTSRKLPIQPRLQNKPTASLKRGKTLLMSVLVWP